MSNSNCCFLTYLQISQQTGRVTRYSHLFKNFPQFIVIHTVKGFSTVNKTDIFLELPCFLYDPTNVGNLISSSSASWKLSLYIWKFSVHILLKPVCCAKSLQWSLNFCDPMNWDPLSSSVHGISQARILEWVVISFSRGSSLTQGSNLHLLQLQHWQAVSLPLVPPSLKDFEHHIVW